MIYILAQYPPTDTGTVMFIEANDINHLLHRLETEDDLILTPKKIGRYDGYTDGSVDYRLFDGEDAAWKFRNMCLANGIKVPPFKS